MIRSHDIMSAFECANTVVEITTSKKSRNRDPLSTNFREKMAKEFSQIEEAYLKRQRKTVAMPQIDVEKPVELYSHQREHSLCS